MSKMSISLPVPKPEMGVRGITGATIYFYDGGKQISQAEYDRQTLASIAAALSADTVVFSPHTKPNPTVARRRKANADATVAAAHSAAAGARDAKDEKEAETPKAERKKKDSLAAELAAWPRVPTNGSPAPYDLADYLENAFAGGKKEHAAKKGSQSARSASGNPPPSGGGKKKGNASGERFSLEETLDK